MKGFHKWGEIFIAAREQEDRCMCGWLLSDIYRGFCATPLGFLRRLLNRQPSPSQLESVVVINSKSISLQR